MADALDKCPSTAGEFTEFGKLVYDFSHPLSLIVDVGKHILLNGVDIYHHLDAAVKAYRAQ